MQFLSSDPLKPRRIGFLKPIQSRRIGLQNPSERSTTNPEQRKLIRSVQPNRIDHADSTIGWVYRTDRMDVFSEDVDAFSKPIRP